jgi:hypothetical protein
MSEQVTLRHNESLKNTTVDRNYYHIATYSSDYPERLLEDIGLNQNHPSLMKETSARVFY